MSKAAILKYKLAWTKYFPAESNVYLLLVESQLEAVSIDGVAQLTNLVC